MKKNLRRIFFWLLFFFFIITTPIAILYSQGYRFDKGRMIFVHSGAITIKSVPSRVDIRLNGKLQPAKSLDIINNSMTIGGLRPGSYHIKAGLDGYSEWEKDVEVHSGLSTEFWNVVLVPKNLALRNIESHNVTRFFPSLSGKKIAYLKSFEENFSLWVTDLKKNETHLVYTENDVSWGGEQSENLEWNSSEEVMLIPVIRENRKDYLVVGNENSPRSLYLSEITRGANLYKARWSPKDESILYLLAKEEQEENTNLYKINLENNELELIAPKANTFDVSQSSLYYVQSNNILLKVSLNGNDISQISDKPLGDQPLGNNARLIVYDETRQALILEDGELILHNKGDQDIVQKIASGIKGIQFSDDGKKMLFWSNNEISTIFLRKWNVQPYREENEIQTIIRLSSPLENVFWYRDYEHIFFSVKNKIKLIELDPRDHRICLDVFENNLSEFPAAYNLQDGYYYFTMNSGEDRKIFYFALPEKIGILG